MIGISLVAVMDAQALSTPRTLATYQPDGYIQEVGGSWLGSDVYNTTGKGQTRSVHLDRRSTVTFELGVQNDGSVDDSFNVDGCRSARGFAISYYDGAFNLTDQITPGTYQTTAQPPGLLAAGIYMDIKAKASTESGDKFRCSVEFWSNGGGIADVVAGRVIVN